MPGLVICCNNSNNTATPGRRCRATNCYLIYFFSLPNKDVAQFFIEQIFFARFLPVTELDKQSNMIIQHKENSNKGAFYIERNGETVAEMVYRMEKDRMVIEHTEVDETLRGQNVGFQLVENGVEYAGEQHLKIVPLCAFAKKVLERHKELQDVL